MQALTLGVVYQGRPWCDKVARTSITPFTLAVVRQARPFVPFERTVYGTARSSDRGQASLLGERGVAGVVVAEAAGEATVLGEKGTPGTARAIARDEASVLGVRGVPGTLSAEAGAESAVTGVRGVPGTPLASAATEGAITGQRGLAGIATSQASSNAAISGARGVPGIAIWSERGWALAVSTSTGGGVIVVPVAKLRITAASIVTRVTARRRLPITRAREGSP